jgi:hypothetical protein
MSYSQIGFPEQHLVYSSKKNREAGTISFILTRLDYLNASESLRVQRQLAAAGFSKIQEQEGMLAHSSEVDKQVETIAKTASFMKLLLDKVGTLIRTGNQIAEVNLDLIITYLEYTSNRSTLSDSPLRQYGLVNFVASSRGAYLRALQLHIILHLHEIIGNRGTSEKR